MPIAASHEVTQLLMAWNDGDQSALERLIPLVHAELHRIARRYMRNERAGHTLQTSALINEAYLRLIDAQQVRFTRFGSSSYLQRRHDPGVVRWPKTRGRKVFRLVSDQLSSERAH